MYWEGVCDVAAKTSPQSVTAESCCGSVLTAPLSRSEADSLARGFAALADPVRLRLLSMIAATDEACSCELLEPLGKSQPTISHHTKALAEAGLITGEKRGRWVYWRVVPDRIEALRQALSPGHAYMSSGG
jgi:ArsR family transcriptional regulator, arsenate/arsenite/antimonite-responsive transcriptional repressor